MVSPWVQHRASWRVVPAGILSKTRESTVVGLERMLTVSYALTLYGGPAAARRKEGRVE
jgi:hypothetical protein